ncbi:MAG: hypothetical protein PHU61_04625 [Candidatus Absconditabacteria bacterium]|nr:hypothetical protein [Candidatus Absconditabacteria bacterium]
MGEAADYEEFLLAGGDIDYESYFEEKPKRKSQKMGFSQFKPEPEKNKEIWKECYDSRYKGKKKIEVSNQGNIKVDGEKKKIVQGKISDMLDSNSFWSSKGGFDYNFVKIGRKYYQMDRFILATFDNVNYCPKKAGIVHLDGNRLNDNLENLHRINQKKTGSFYKTLMAGKEDPIKKYHEELDGLTCYIRGDEYCKICKRHKDAIKDRRTVKKSEERA